MVTLNSACQRGRRQLYLTKSLFQSAVTCPAKLELYQRNFPIQTRSRFLDSLVQDGQTVGAYARLLYPGGSLIEGGSMESLVHRTRAMLMDEEDRKAGTTLFEGAIQHGACLVRADILHRPFASSTLDLLEVKAKSFDSSKGMSQIVTEKGGIRSDWLPYIQDVAFQKYVIQRAFPGLCVRAKLVLPDKKKRNRIHGLKNMLKLKEGCVNLDEETKALILNQYATIASDDSTSNAMIHGTDHWDDLLLAVIDVNAMVEAVLRSELVFPGSSGDNFEIAVNTWEKRIDASLSERDEIAGGSHLPPIGTQCRECEFRTSPAEQTTFKTESGFRRCWEQAANLGGDLDDLVIDMYHGGRTATSLIRDQKYTFSDVSTGDLGLNDNGIELKKKDQMGMSRKERQWLQIQSSQPIKGIVLEKKYISEEMAEWRYPYHFIDFETALPAIPYAVGKKPFQMLAFQFSHHTLFEDGRVEHTSEFLHATPDECPNLPFLNALDRALENCNGSVFRWGAHENTVLKALLESEDFESSGLNSLLSSGDRAMIDLAGVLTKCYYVAGSGASSSIKKVLLPTLKLSDYLKERYGAPNYNGSNFTEFQWWKVDEKGIPVDPYALLVDPDTNVGSVSHGGDAMAAFATLQQPMSPEAREALCTSLLRYCELDTLAMVMITQALIHMVQDETVESF